MYKFYLFVLLTLTIIQFGSSAKTQKTPNKAEMGIPFKFKHANSAMFYDGPNMTSTAKPKSKGKRQKRMTEIESLDSNAKRYSFSFKSLAELDLPLSEHGDENQDYNRENSNHAEFRGLNKEHMEKGNQDFLGRIAPELQPPTGKSRLTERLLKTLTPEQTSEKVSSVIP